MAISGKTTGKNVHISIGIILGFFSIFLIFYGVFLSNFIEEYQKNNPMGILPIYISYLPLVCYIGALFLGIGLFIYIRNVNMQKTREIQSRKKVKSGSIYKEALFLTIFIFAFVPLFGPIFDQGKNTQNFSIYNEDWNGASDFRTTIEQEGYEIMSIQSSLSATERLNKSVLLILLGPNQFYNPIFEVPYFIEFFENNSQNSLLICHDHGSTSTLLWEIFIASAMDPDIQGSVPVAIFPDGILRDNFSYDTRPDFPVIRSFGAHQTTIGITDILLSQASSALGEPFTSIPPGWDVVGYSSDYAFVDKNDDKIYNEADDYLDLSLMTAMLPGLPSRWPLAGYSHAVFMAKDLGTSRVFVSADASLFNNELINNPSYQNRQFAINIVNWLTFEETDNWVVAFDEAHIRPEYSSDLSSAGIFGFILQYIVHLSTNPITSWIYPIIAVYTLRKYLPKKDEKAQKKKAKDQERKEEKERFRTSSFFAEKIEWYREKANYGKALVLLYRRLERKLNNLLGNRKITTKNVIDIIIAKEPNITKLKIKRISRFMDRITAIKEGKSKVKNEQDFEDLFFEMEWVVNNL
ncbi:MAG: hypothetical protein EU531_08760 [Promethearchaeota archaeon]|nr:MAG: hypothetical protein EU531_08760 [Candidatus Lokiarchaeota archaeon]